MSQARLLAVLLCIAPVAVHASVSDETASLARDFGVVARDVQRRDFAAVVAHLPERFTRTAKSRAEVRQSIEDSFGYLNYLGLETIVLRMERPGPIERHGALHTSLVPLIATVDGSGGTVVARTYVLAESRDGRTWRFFPLIQETSATANAAYPEFKGRLKVPDTAVLKYEMKAGIGRFLGPLSGR